MVFLFYFLTPLTGLTASDSDEEELLLESEQMTFTYSLLVTQLAFILPALNINFLFEKIKINHLLYYHIMKQHLKHFYLIQLHL